MQKYEVFIDSNVFISGLYSSKRSPGKIIDYFVRGKIDIFISQKVLREIIMVISEKIPGILPVLNRFLTSYPPEIIRNPEPGEIKKWSGIINEDDAMILESAIMCRPDYFITGDKHFFNSDKILEESGLKIIRPSEFIDIVEKENI